MKLIKLKIKNFKTHVDSEIDFTELNSPVLIKGLNKDTGGSNGAGKSSIFDAIEYVFYSKDNRYLRNGENEGEVILEFEKDKIIHKIIKRMKKDSYEILLYKNNEIFSNTKTEIEKYIRDTLRVSKSLFDQTIFQSQGFNQFFGLLSPKLKSEFIMELLEMEKWEKFEDTAQQYYKTLNDLYTKLLMKKEMLENNIKELEKSLSTKNELNIKQEIEQKTLAIKIKQNTLETLKNEKLILEKKETLKKTIEETNKLLKKIRSELSEKRQKLEKYKEMKKDLDSKKVNAVDETYRKNLITSAIALEKNIAALQHELSIKKEELSKFLTTYNSILSASLCPFCKRIIDNNCRSDLINYINSEKTSRETYINELVNKITSQESQRATYAKQVENLEQQCRIYNAHIKNLEDLNNNISLLSSEILSLEEKEKDSLAILKPTQQEYDLIKQSDLMKTEEYIKVIESDLNNLNDSLQNLKTQYSMIQEEKNKIILYKNNLDLISNEISQYTKALNILSHVKSIFSQNGVQKWLFMNTLNEISSLANSLMLPTHFSIIFQMEKPKKTSEGFKPVFDILIVKNKSNKLYPLEVLSGGERSIIHFAIRLAFSTIMAMKYNFEFMIIDEGFTDLDEKNRELVASMIHQLSNQFQIFLITHLSDFENMFNNIIYVERENNISKIEIKKAVE